MVAKNIFHKGIVRSVSIENQPSDSLRDNVNGSVIQGDGGNFIYRNTKGNELSFTLDANDRIIGAIKIKNGLFICTKYGVYDKIYTVIFDTSMVADVVKIYYSQYLNFGYDSPISGIYIPENEENEPVYFWDNRNPPRVINIATDPIDLALIPAHHLSYSPKMGMPEMEMDYIHGSLMEGMYGYAVRLKTKNRTYTDWSYVSKGFPVVTLPTEDRAVETIAFTLGTGDQPMPGQSLTQETSGATVTIYSIEITSGSFAGGDAAGIIVFHHATGAWDNSAPKYLEGATAADRITTDGDYIESVETRFVFTKEDYQAERSIGVNAVTNMGVRITCTDVDTDFDEIELVAFDSDAVDSVLVGSLIERKEITSGTIVFNHILNGGIEPVTINQVNTSTISIVKNKTGDSGKSLHVLGNIEERPEFTDHEVTAEISPITYELPCDIMGTPDSTPAPNTFVGHEIHDTIKKVYSQQWYKIEGTVLVKAPGFEDFTVESGYNCPDYAASPETIILSNNNSTTETAKYVGATFNIYQVGGPSVGLVITGTVISYDEFTRELVLSIPAGWYDDEEMEDFNQSWRIVIIENGAYGSDYSYTDETFLCPAYADYTLSPGSVLTPIIRLPQYKHMTTVGGEAVWTYKDYELEGFLDYKNPKISQIMSSFAGGETIRVGLLPFDGYGKRMSVIWLDNIDIPERNHKFGGIYELMKGYKELVGDTANTQWNINALGLFINNLDLTSIINNITGFSIVYAPVTENIIAEGYTKTTCILDTGDIYYPKRAWYRNGSAYKRAEGYHTFHSPEYLFGKQDIEIKEGDYIKLVSYIKPYIDDATPAPANSEGITCNPNHLYLKGYEMEDNLTAGLSPVGTKKKIDKIWKTSPGKEISNVNEHDDGFIFDNHTYLDRTSTSPELNLGSDGVLLLLKDDEGENGYGSLETMTVTYPNNVLAYSQIIRPKASPQENADNEIYYFTGHYQHVDSAFRSSILIGVNYIVQGLKVFGGDRFVNPFDIQAIIPDEFATQTYGQALIAPIQSKVNIALRGGDHFAKEDNIGLDTSTGLINLAEFYYNLGFSSKTFGDFYLSLDLSNLVPEGRTVYRWSNRKIPGERINSFCRFYPDNYRRLSLSDGELNALRYVKNGFYYWQETDVGFIPIDERALQNTVSGQTLLLGESSGIKRDDSVSSSVGVSSDSGIVRAVDAFVWYDQNNFNFYSINGGQIKMLPEMSYMVRQEFGKSFIDVNSPYFNGGLTGIYNEFSGLVHYLMFDSNQSIVFDFDPIQGFFSGRHTYLPIFMQMVRGSLITGNSNTGWKHGEGNYGSFYGVIHDSYFEIIVGNDNTEENIYDLLEIIGNEILASSIDFETTEGHVIENLVNDSEELLQESYYFYNGRWHGTFPLNTDDDRLRGDRIKMIIKINNIRNKLMRIVEIQSTIRKDY